MSSQFRAIDSVLDRQQPCPRCGAHDGVGLPGWCDNCQSHTFVEDEGVWGYLEGSVVAAIGPGALLGMDARAVVPECYIAKTGKGKFRVRVEWDAERADFPPAPEFNWIETKSNQNPKAGGSRKS